MLLSPVRRSLVVFVLALAACQHGGVEGGLATTQTETVSSDVAESGVETGSETSGTTATGEVVGGPRHDVLFVGNSYVYVNDVAGHTRAIAEALTPGVRVEAVTAAGYTLAQHATDARTDGTPLARWLRTGTPEDTAFAAVVLQEQSQIGGFPATTAERRASRAGASELATLATARGAAVVLYQTWGHEHGDPTNAALGFGTYVGMQSALDEGYLGLAADLKEAGVDVRVAPVGGAFHTVFADVTSNGGDPLADGSDFDLLYEADGSHPSLRGAYLASCVIAGTITGADAYGFIDEPVLGSEVSRRLRDVCARTLADPHWRVPVVLRPTAVLAGDPVQAMFFGDAVAVDAAGTRVMVGARALSSGASARMFVRTAAGWSEEALWRGAGSSVALSGDGARAIVGVPWRVYRREGTSWTEEALTEPRPVGSDSLALSVDGQRAIVGGSAGAYGDITKVFARALLPSAGSWGEEDLVGSEDFSTGQASSVAVDATGVRAIVGTQGSFVARAFVRAAAGWVEAGLLDAHIPHTVSSHLEVALAANGSRAAVGVPEQDRVVTFVRSGETWIEETTVSGRLFSAFGSSVALSADGQRLVVGAPGDSPAATEPGAGSARVYEFRSHAGVAGPGARDPREATGFDDGVAREVALLVPRVGAALDSFGQRLAISGDGTVVVVGAPGVDITDGPGYVGAAYVFELQP